MQAHDRSSDDYQRSVAPDAPGGATGATSAAGASPRPVIRGESFDEAIRALTEGYSATTDYLNCTFRYPGQTGGLSAMFQRLFACLGRSFAPVESRNCGKYGYVDSYDLGESSALFCVGGQRGTALLSLPGSACNLVPSWHALIRLLASEWDARITRWDGAVDDFVGAHSVDQATQMYLANAFTNGGNRPSCSQRGNWLEPDGTGRTFYVGKRENGKILRVYEKGLQLYPRSGLPWVRWEVEVHNVDREIPWEVLLEPGKYFVGAYPKALGWAHEEMSRIRTLRSEATASYGHLLRCAGVAYGAFINVMLAHEGSAEKVVEALRRPGVPARLRYVPLPDGTKVFP